MATNNSINGVTGSMITKYTASNTWNKNVNTQMVEVIVWNSGAGGGSGRQATSTTSGGGAGGAAGGMATWFGSARLLGSSETVTVASGGAGGLTQASTTSDGNAGAAGGTSSFGNIAMTQITLTSPGGVATTATATTASSSTFWQLSVSVNGPLTGNNAGNGRNVAGVSASAQYSIITPLTDQIFGQQMPSAGGGGGGADTVVIRTGGVGGNIFLATGHIVGSTPTPATIVYAGGTAGIESGTINGGIGTSATNTSGGIYYGGAGGGGGGGQSAGGAAGIGGAGGTPGGGGGGGGGSLNGTTSGAGGAGGRGEVWVIEYF